MSYEPALSTSPHNFFYYAVSIYPSNLFQFSSSPFLLTFFQYETIINNPLHLWNMSKWAKRVIKSTVNRTTSEDHVEQYQSLFPDLFEGKINDNINIFSCIPFKCVQGTAECGVMKLIHLYHRTLKYGYGEESTSHALGTSTPLVVPLKLSLKHYLHSYFRDRLLCADEVEAEVSIRHVWYRIIDVNHR